MAFDPLTADTADSFSSIFANTTPTVGEALAEWRDTQSGHAFRAVVLAALEDGLVNTAELRRAHPNHAEVFVVAKLRNNSGSKLPHARAQAMIIETIADRWLAAEREAKTGIPTNRPAFAGASLGISDSTPSSPPRRYDRAAAMRDAPDLRRMAGGHQLRRL